MSTENTTKLTEVLDRLADNQLADAKRIATHEANYIHLADVVEKMGVAQTTAMVELSKNVSEMSTNIKLMSSDNDQVKERLEIMDETLRSRICEVRKEFTGAITRIDEVQEKHSTQLGKLKVAIAHSEGVDEAETKFKDWLGANWFKIGSFIAFLISLVYTSAVFIERTPRATTSKHLTIEKVIVPATENMNDAEYTVEKP